MITNLILSAYALFLFAGSYFGWKSGSTISLYMGIISGVLVVIGLLIQSKNPVLGYQILALTSGALTFVFLIRFLKTHAFMPAGMLFWVSLAAFILSLIKLFK